jgi:hypothetical protein
MTTAAATPNRYTNHKTHPCGCTTTWNTHTNNPQYITACNTHRQYARKYPANPS